MRVFFLNGHKFFSTIPRIWKSFFSTITYMTSSEKFNVRKLWVICMYFVSFAFVCSEIYKMGRIKRIWYLSPMRAAKVQVSLRIRAVSPEPPLLTHTSSESRGTFRQKARSLAPLNGWACTFKICHDGMLKDTNSLDAAQIMKLMFALTM